MGQLVDRMARRLRLARALWQQDTLGPFLQQRLFRAYRRHKWVRLEPGQYLDTQIEPGVWMRLPREVGLAELIYLHPYELDVREFIRRYLQVGNVFVDVGAHIGYFSMIAARKVGVTGCVYAFEPSPDTFQHLQANVALNRFPQVICVPVAVSDQSGSAVLCTRVGEASDAFNTLGDMSWGGPVNESEVTCVRLEDYLCEQGQPAVHLVKIDVEGWETHVLRGAESLLVGPDAPALVIEFSDWLAEAAGSSTQALRAQIEGLGYSLYRYDPAGVLIEPVNRINWHYDNLVATKDPEATLRRLSAHYQELA